MTPTHPQITAPHHSALRRLRRAALFVAAACTLIGVTLPATAQQRSDLGFTYTQERTKFVGSGTNPYFMVRGATVDLGFELGKNLGLAVNGTGTSAVNLRGGLDVEQASFAAGPRYTWNWGHITPTATTRKGSVFVEGLAGYTIAISGAYPVNGTIMDHASSLTYLGGGGVNLHIYDRFDLRLLQADYVRTQLPNGGTNVQNTLRLGAGINFHFGL